MKSTAIAGNRTNRSYAVAGGIQLKTFLHLRIKCLRNETVNYFFYTRYITFRFAIIIVAYFTQSVM
jgi:hypothetical protein